MSKYGDILLRQHAAAAGQKRYVSERACVRGHVGERYTSTAACIECLGRFKVATVAKVGPYQVPFVFQVPMPDDVPTPDALRVYLVECMNKWYETNGPRVPFDSLALHVMRSTGKPYGTGKLADCATLPA